MTHSKPQPSIRSRIVERVVSAPGTMNRLRARRGGLDYLLGRPPQLELYYEPGDPHSHLAAQLLPTLAQRLRIPLCIRLVGESDPAVYPEQQKQREFALQDATRIAPAYGLSFPDAAQRPSAEAIMQGARALLATGSLDEFMSAESQVAAQLFQGETPQPKANAPSLSEVQAELSRNHKRRAALGNYLPAVWQLNGQWYWSIGRLDHLEMDLRHGGWLEGDEALTSFDPGQAALPDLPLDTLELEFFYSFRSPYSYLAAEALLALQDNLPVPLRIRPVLPMAMRGMKIPPYKGLYIARDTYREAEKRNIPFGRIADPLGVATERCLSLFNLLDDTKQQLAFIVSNSRAVWSEGIDVADDDGLRYVWERAGLDWAAAQAKLAQGMDLELAEINRQALFDAGLWGVPSFRLGSFASWGNDRIWMLQEIFRRQTSIA